MPSSTGRGASGGRPPKTGQSKGADARRVAYDVLRAVDDRDAYANLLLPAKLREARLDRREAALATELTYGTLRGSGCYDEIVGVCSDRDVTRVDPPLLDVLRLGAHQLLATRIPDHAAVGETVALARAVVGGGAARFANAVLRKVATRGLDDWISIVAPSFDTDPVGRLAVAHSHPRWIVSAVRDALAGDLDETRAFLAANNTPARVMLAATPGRSTVEELAESGARRAPYSPYAAYLAEGDPASVPAVTDRRATVQDEGSQLVALALANAPLDGDAGGPDTAWLDLCAGPGGKAALLGGLAEGREARVIAADRQHHRARLARRAVDGDTVAVVCADGAVPAWPDGRFDRVLVDAPCTGLGALRRRPELRWRRQPSDVASARPPQRALLEAALSAVRPGGAVAYVTCSPHIAETSLVVDDVLRAAARSDGGAAAAEPIDARPLLPGAPGLGDGPHIQLWPHRHGTDAMFLALLRKTG